MTEQIRHFINFISLWSLFVILAYMINLSPMIAVFVNPFNLLVKWFNNAKNSGNWIMMILTGILILTVVAILGIIPYKLIYKW